MQLANQECFKDRAYFYDSRMFTEQLPRGNAHRFCDIKETHFIGILDFILPDSSKGDYVHDIGPAYLSTGKSFYENKRFKFIELPKFNKQLNELKTGLDKWLHLLKHLHEMTDIPSIFHEPVFKEVFRIAEQSNLNQEEQTMYRTSLQDQLDYQESIRTEKQEDQQKGIEKGMEQGMKQEKGRAKRREK